VRFDKHIGKKYRKSIEDAFDTILVKGSDAHRVYMNAILESEMLVKALPVKEVNASGITGLISSVKTNYRLATERMDLVDALGEVYITIAEETIDTGGQRGCEGTFVHEGRHAYDFALALESLSNADMNPIGIYDPTHYELEWNAHKAAAEYMVLRAEREFVDEGVQLMILHLGDDGSCFVNDDGIRRRLNESYGLAIDANQGPLASRMMGIVV
jgi:hypothetical protein